VNDDERGAEWERFLSESDTYISLMLGLETLRDRRVWMYIIGTAAELEYLAVVLLWIRDGKPGSLEGYEERMTLGQAAKALEALGLLDAGVITTLKDVATLRNSIAHRGIVAGAVVPGQARVAYKGGPVFTDLDALKALAHDVDAAVGLIRSRCNDLDPPPK